MHACLTLAQQAVVERQSDFVDVIDGNFMWFVIGVLVFTGILVGGIRKAMAASAQERSRREIAAYIAEGSMTPEQGERLMNAGGSVDDD